MTAGKYVPEAPGTGCVTTRLPVFKLAQCELDAYFPWQTARIQRAAGARTDFQKRVWTALTFKIPFGETRTYGQQAAMIGQPTAVRGWHRQWQESHRHHRALPP